MKREINNTLVQLAAVADLLGRKLLKLADRICLI
jgi:hypothetical protein